MIVKVKGIDEHSLFPLGRVVVTNGIMDTIPPEDVLLGVQRHSQGDWGELCGHDWQENELSLKEGFRLLSSYRTGDGTKFWVITEHDRSYTTVLLPAEY